MTNVQPTSNQRAQPTPLEALLDRAAATPDATALIADGETWSCSRLATESARLADAFRTSGVEPGARVALHMYNRPELVLAYLACWRIGAVAVPLNTRWKTPEVVAALSRTTPVLYLGESELYDEIAADLGDAVPPAARFMVDRKAAANDARPWQALVEQGGDDRTDPMRAPTVDRDAPAVLLATSGTTGDSKLVVWTAGVLASFALSADARGMGADDVVLLTVPMMHASGMTLFPSCLLTGAVIVLVPRFDPEQVRDAIAEHRCTAMLGLPMFFAGVARCQQAESKDLGSLRTAIAGGDVCPVETMEAFEAATGCALRSFWVSTEDSVCGLRASQQGPLTVLLPQTEVRFVDDEGADVADDETGEMLVRSPGTAPGYWRESGRIDPLPDGWFHSGDLMRRESDGELRYMGRTKDLIVRGGSNISSVEVEHVLRDQAGVADAAVVGLPDPELGERVGAVLVLADGTTDTAVSDILAAARQALADYKVPEQVAVVDEIPVNAMAKVDRAAVAELIQKENA